MKEQEFDKETGANLPVAMDISSEDDDDGIFLNWPGADFPAGAEGDDEEDSPEEETSDEDPDEIPDTADEDDDDGLHSKKDRHAASAQKKKEKKAPKGKSRGESADSTRTGGKPDEETRQFAFRRAEESDLEESSGRRHRPKKKEEDNEATLSSMKYYKHTRQVRAVMLRRVLPLVLVVSFLAGFILYFFRLQHLTFDNLTGYAAEDVFRASGLKKNMFVFAVSEGDIERRLRQRFPYIQDIEVERELPDTVHLIFTEDCAKFYTEMYGEYFVISESMRILARCDTEKELPEDLRKLTLPAVSYAVVGHKLQFFDASYVLFLSEIIDIIKESAVYDKIHEMDLSNRYYLSLRYDNRLTFDIGTAENLDTKMLYIKSLVESLKPDDHGTVTLIGNKVATFAADPIVSEE
ncbi:MAG: FtsQ-type POTRA domain-containing protein [Clostridia bacterium]|nr:FtsQ-type POTRA domain-containing protein [Clostridia bacterium]